MKGLILSGGLGSRLRPITHTRSKQLIPIANKPVLFYAIDALLQAGICEIGIVVGDTGREIKKAVGKAYGRGAGITYIRQSRPLGIAHAIRISEDFIGKSRFVVFLGDNLINGSLFPYADSFQSSGADAMVLLAKVPDPTLFGVAIMKKGKVIGLVEKPKRPPSNYALAGIYFFSSGIFKAVKSIGLSKRGEYEITDSIQYLMDTGRHVISRKISGWWKDTGKIEDLLEANKLILDGTVRKIEGEIDEKSKISGSVRIDGARVVNSVIKGPSVIGRGSSIINSEIQPYTSIGPGCVIEGSSIGYSIVMARSSITGITSGLGHCLIGEEAEVKFRSGKTPYSSLHLGDCSRVSL